MDRREPSRGMRGPLAQCLVALGIIATAFWVSDVSPGQPLHPVVEDEPWVAPLRAVDNALGQRDLSGAERAWKEAYGHALASRGFAAMLAVGDASARIARIAGPRTGAEARARSAYLAAFVRARRQQAVDGVLQTAQAFADLGDREVVEHCLRAARDLAVRTGDAEAEARVSAMAGRLAAR